MPSYRYETHRLLSPQLPFIYHPYFRVERTHKIPNWHENLELIQCTGGEGSVRCGPEAYSLRQGELLFIGSNIPHSIGSDSAMTYRCLIIDNSFFLENGVPVDSLQFESRPKSPRVIKAFAAAVEAFESRREGDFHSVLAIRCAALALVQALCDVCILTARRPEAQSDHVRRALEYLRQHLFEPITLEAVAEHAGVSKFHLARQFKLYTGRTIVQMVNLMRCTEAQHRLEQGMSVSEAAAVCGFESPSYFTRTYKALMGTLPSQALPK